MKSSFKGIPKEGLVFLADLEKNNNREWFERNKPRFEADVRH